MAIEDRNIKAGQVFVARYKGEDYKATASEKDGKTTFAVDGIEGEFTSLSSAGSKVMNGVACNGWRFWSPEGQAPAPRGRKAKENSGTETTKTKTPRSRKPKKVQVVQKIKDQGGAEEGMIMYHCSACMDAFELPKADAFPTECPQGPAAVQDDDLAPDFGLTGNGATETPSTPEDEVETITA